MQGSRLRSPHSRLVRVTDDASARQRFQYCEAPAQRHGTREHLGRQTACGSDMLLKAQHRA
jgi:hypothetical protein